MRQYLQLKDLLGMSSIEVGKLLGMKQLLILFRKKNKIRERKKNENEDEDEQESIVNYLRLTNFIDYLIGIRDIETRVVCRH